MLSICGSSCEKAEVIGVFDKKIIPEPVSDSDEGKIETIVLHSTAMNKDMKTSVILPKTYRSQSQLPVLYLLHGFGGDHSVLINSIPDLQSLSDKYGYIIVCPDGGKSWYLDSPVDPAYKYETYIIEELIDFIDNNYKTDKRREKRAIAGISMGGHGSMYLAFRHQELFGAVGSIMGGVDFRPFPESWELKYRLGTKDEYPINWEDNTVINMTSLLSPNSLDIIFDCGTEDPYFKTANQLLHEKLIGLGIAHKYITESGMHDYDYVKKAILWQTKFFSDYFAK
ncbi:esterase family protein [Sphingobacterium sp. SGG-5]|nr:esterase family protein [Sphingobacterium sp. SGG-5]